jgi:L-iditol 2-dehydrogenase
VKAAVLTEPFRVELGERRLPSLAPGQARIRVQQCGLCTSEVDLWLGKAPDKLPAAIGHEIAGIVEETGRDVTALSVGDRVVAWIHEGGFAEETIVDEHHAIRVPAHVSYPAVAEPLACVINAVELAAPALADDILIIGAGYMGNLLQLVTALKGPRSVTVADVRPDALERARTLGATRVADTNDESLAEVLRELTGGDGVDLTYEVTGVNAGLEVAGQSTRIGGKLCIVGYHQGDARTIPLAHWNWMAFQIVNAHFRNHQTIMAGMRAGMRLVSAGLLDVAPLVTHIYPLAEITQAFETATAKPDGFIKALIEPNGAGGPASNAR